MALAGYSVVVQDPATGESVEGASIEVRSETTGLLVPLFSDIEGLDAIGNPFLSEENGVAEFFTTPDFYQITATKDALTSTMRHVCIGPIGRSVGDPQDRDTDAYDAINHRYNNAVSGLTAETTQEAVDEIAALLTFSGSILTFGAGVALPGTNIGPIYHVDYASIMTWQVFNANGAAYTGYASIGIGKPSFELMTAARAGELKLDGSSKSKTTYAALYGWAKHNNLVVASGDWTAGTNEFGEVDESNFRLPDPRGEFIRVADEGRGVDTDRVTGSWQDHQLQDHKHTTAAVAFTGAAGADAGTGYSAGAITSSDPTTGNHGTETRPRNVALPTSIKF